MDIWHKLPATNAAKPHDNQRVLEGDHSALRVCEPSILTHRVHKRCGDPKIHDYILYSCIHIIYVSSCVYISLRMATYINIAYQLHHLWDVRSWILALSPASKIWSIRLKTSGCAFSTSSKSTKPWHSKVQAAKSCATKSTNNLWLWYSIDIHWQWMTNTCRSIQYYIQLSYSYYLVVAACDI